jgi:hypothetical protein
VVEPASEITAQVLAALPQPDVALDPPAPAVKYVHRRWRDAEAYFFFNESDQPQSLKAVLEGAGKVQLWDAASGAISLLAGATQEKHSVRVPLDLPPYGSKIVVIGVTGR